MKFTFRGIIAALFCVMFIYTACKKLNSTPQAKIASTQEVAGIVATDFEASLNGTYGGGIGDGIKPTAAVESVTHSLVTNSIHSLCGFKVDTTFTYTVTSGSAKSTVTGKFIFIYTCGGGSAFPNGYVVKTDLTSKGHTSTYSYTYKIAQDDTVQTLVPNDTLVSLNGTQKSYGDFKLKAGPGIDTNFTKPQYQHQDYVLKNLVIDVPQGLDITSGLATFTSTGSNAFGSWSYSGTIEFIGGHMAIVTIDGKQYKVNLITGVVTPI